MKSAKFLFILAVSSLLLSCRKGPEDPLLSLQTRKSRICTPWRLESSVSTTLTTSRSNSFVTVTDESTVASRDSVKMIITNAGDTFRVSKGFYYDCQFFRDQSFLSNTITHFSSADTITQGFNPETFADYIYVRITDSLVETGTYGSWSFFTEPDSRKNELLVVSENRSTRLITSSQKYASLNGGPPLKDISKVIASETKSENPSLKQYNITRLTNNELVLTRMLDSSYTSWVNNTFPVAVRVSGNERIELKSR